MQACKNRKIVLVEYAQPVNLTSPDVTAATPKVTQPNKHLPNITESTNTDICQYTDLLQDDINTYTVLLNRPHTVEDRRKLCSQLTKNVANKNNRTFYAVAYSKQRYETKGSYVKLVEKLNLKALKYVS